MSKRVRSMYDCGGESTVDLTGETVEEEDEEAADKSSPGPYLGVHQNGSINSTPTINNPQRNSLFVRKTFELAGGLEDWEDIAGGEVDRYGFIIQNKTESRGSHKSNSAIEQLLQSSATPRKSHAVRRSSSNAKSSNAKSSNARPRSRLQKSPRSMYSYGSNKSYSQLGGTLRYAANRLPHNKNRRWMDEAGDMLTPPPGLAQLAELAEGGRAALAA